MEEQCKYLYCMPIDSPDKQIQRHQLKDTEAVIDKGCFTKGKSAVHFAREWFFSLVIAEKIPLQSKQPIFL